MKVGHSLHLAEIIFPEYKKGDNKKLCILTVSEKQIQKEFIAKMKQMKILSWIMSMVSGEHMIYASGLKPK